MALCKFLFKSMNNVMDPSNLPFDVRGGFSQEFAAEITNCDTKTPNGARLRRGYTEVLNTPCHSGWSDGTIAYYVSFSALYSFNGTASTKLCQLSTDRSACFCKVNDIVVMSNGIDYLLLSGNDVFTPVKSSLEFKIVPPPAQALAFYNARVYLGVSNALYCTDSFSAETCDTRQMGIDSYRDDVTMIAPVDRGLFVGTENEIFFYRGDDPYAEGSFTKTKVADFGAIANTAVPLQGSEIISLKLSGSAMIFASTRGICVCSSSGEIVNLSEGIVDYKHDNVGSSILRDSGGERHFIASFIRKHSEENVYTKPEFVVDDESL